MRGKQSNDRGDFGGMATTATDRSAADGWLFASPEVAFDLLGSGVRDTAARVPATSE